MRRRTTDGPDTSMEGYHRNRKNRDPSFGSIRKERKNFSQEQKGILMEYIKLHLEDCYPDPKEKEMLAQKAGLSLSQVSDFMINARRRILPQLRIEQGLPPENPRKRKMKNEDALPSSTKRKMASESDDSLSSGSSSLSSGASSARNENDEVFEPEEPTSPLRSSESDRLKALNPSSYSVDSLRIRTEDYERQDGGASTSHSISSSPSPSSSLSPVHSDSDDSTSKPPTEELRVAGQCDDPIPNKIQKCHTAQEWFAANILAGLSMFPTAFSDVKNQ